MNNLDVMLKRNKEYAGQESEPGARAVMPQSLPQVKAVVIGCADMRVDPAHVPESNRARPSS
jgi:carbonic anhydrase